MRKCTLSVAGFVLTGGDFESFEVCLADAVYNDPRLRQDLPRVRKFTHCLLEELFPSYMQMRLTQAKNLNPTTIRVNEASLRSSMGRRKHAQS